METRSSLRSKKLLTMFRTSARVELGLQRTFASLARTTAVRPLTTSLSTLFVLSALGFGVYNVKVETDVLKLWVDDSTSLIDNLEFYEDNYATSRTDSFLLTAKPGKSLLTRQAFDELRDLQSWIKTVEYRHPGFARPIRLENICYKVVDGKDNYLPCFQVSPLDCFKEGEAAVIGGENNTEYAGTYASRKSYNDSTFDFAADLSKQYLKDSCKQWYDLGVPYRMIFGGASFNADGVMSRAHAMRTVLATFDDSRLAKVGLRYTDWMPVERDSATEGVGIDMVGCPASGPTLDDCTCSDKFSMIKSLQFGCIPENVPQPSTCCQGFMKTVSEHKCAAYMVTTNSDVNTVGTLVLNGCGMPLVKPLESRCSPHADGLTYPAPFDFLTLDASQCGALSAGLRKCAAGIGGNYSMAIDCCVDTQRFSDGGCVCTSCDGACSRVIDQAKEMCGGYRIQDKPSCPAPSALPAAAPTADPTVACKSKHDAFLVQSAKYEAAAAIDDATAMSAGMAMCAQAGSLDKDECHCLDAVDTGLNATSLALIRGGCALQLSQTFTGLASCPPIATSACQAGAADFLAKCAASRANPDDTASGIACCMAAAPMGASCACTLSEDDKVYHGEVAKVCVAVGLTVETPTCSDAATDVAPNNASQTCEADTATMFVACDAASAASGDIAAGMSCCAAATLVSACSCSLSSNRTLYFAEVATQCNSFGLTVETPTCTSTAALGSASTAASGSATSPLAMPQILDPTRRHQALNSKP